MSRISLSILLALLATFFASVLSTPGPLVLDLQLDDGQSEQSQMARKQLMRRAGPVSTSNFIDTANNLYYVKVSVGTPKQNSWMYVSTNSADIVLIAQSNPYCANNACSNWGTYSANDSSTYKWSKKFSYTYADGKIGSGDVISDVLSIGSTNLNDVTALVSYTSNLSIPILGIGYISLEATDRYANLPVQMFNNKFINVAGYSLYYNHTNATSAGQVIFGGIDTNKFYGTLETLSIATANNAEYRYTLVSVSGMSVFNGATNYTLSGASFAVVPDSGTRNLILPPTVVQQIITQLNATLSGSAYVAPLASVSDQTTISFVFGSTTVKIPIYDMWSSKNSTHGTLLLSASTGDSNWIGLPFFRNAYTVTDYSHNQFSVAQLKHDAVSDNVTLIPSAGASGIVGYVANSGNTSTNGTNSNGSGNGGNNGNNNNNGSGGLSTGAKAGIGIGCALGAIAVIGAIVFFVLRSRKNKKRQANAVSNTAPPMAGAPAVPYDPYQQAQPGYHQDVKPGAGYYVPGPGPHPRENYGAYKPELAGDSTANAGGLHAGRETHGYDDFRSSTASPTLAPSSPGQHPAEMYAGPGAMNGNSVGSANGYGEGVKRKPIAPSELP